MTENIDSKFSFAFIKRHWLIFAIILIGSFLRLWQIDTHAILFSDAGKDLLVAEHSLQEHKLPLLGIASSVPRFKQGPIAIWIEMISIAIFGINTLAVSIIFALLAIIAIIGLYELVCVSVGRWQAITAALILAVSPLAVAHARVPYHTTPLPLTMVLYLASLLSLEKKKPRHFFLCGLAFSFLFQFELAVAPLLLLLPFTLWYQKIELEKKLVLWGCAGLAAGILPQLIYDVTHNFSQIGVFILWIGHKILEFVSLQGGGSITFASYGQSLLTHGTRILSTWPILSAPILLAAIVVGIVMAIRQWSQKKLSLLYALAYTASIVLLLSYFVHGSPSEAYFPPFLILVPLILSHLIFSLPKKFRLLSFGLLLILVILNSIQIFQYNFFVSNEKNFYYGPSVEEQRKVLRFISSKSNGHYTLKTFNGYEDEFVNYFDNYRWLAKEMNIAETDKNKKYFYIEHSENPVANKQYFHYKFDTVTVYWPIDF